MTTQKKIRATRKLRGAIDILGDDVRGCDCGEDAFIAALRKRKINQAQIYKAMQLMRYVWNANRGYWVWKPRYLKSVQRLFSSVIKQADVIDSE